MEFKFHPLICPNCNIQFENVIVGDPGFAVVKCNHCGQIYVARAIDGEVRYYKANQYQIEALISYQSKFNIIPNDKELNRILNT